MIVFFYLFIWVKFVDVSIYVFEKWGVQLLIENKSPFESRTVKLIKAH